MQLNNKITAEFSSVEEAERAATRLRRNVDGLGRITVTSRTAKKDIDTPFMLPYAPQNGLDPWIMIPANYGYATDTGYLENISSVTCEVAVEAGANAESVRAVLNNSGALSVK